MKLSYFTFISLSLALSHVSAQDPSPEPFLTDADNVSPDPNQFKTDFAAIEATIFNVDQTSSVDPEARPNQRPAATEVTAVDGELTDAGTASQRRSHLVVAEERSLAPQVWERRFNKGNIVKAEERAASDYIKVFDASTSARDASIQGTSYLTYKLVSNATYSVNDCLAFCDSVPQCRFANLYYEFNNALYDWVFSEKSNLACALYGDVHTAAEKTNFAGQQLKPAPEPLTSITRSTGWAKEAPYTPPTPQGYSLSFGPLSKATNQGFSLGFSTLSNYDVAACAALCNAKESHPELGLCQSFNIWRALVDRVPTTYTCQLYAVAIDASSANYAGSGLEVTLSRGYNRIDSVVDGKALDSGAWAIQNYYGAGITGYGHYTNRIANSFYSGYISYNRYTPNFLRARNPLSLIPGKQYVLQFWYQQESYENVFTVKWNGANAYTVANQPHTLGVWKPVSITVNAYQFNSLEFSGGAYLGYSYLSDISLFLV